MGKRGKRSYCEQDPPSLDVPEENLRHQLMADANERSVNIDQRGITVSYSCSSGTNGR